MILLRPRNTYFQTLMIIVDTYLPKVGNDNVISICKESSFKFFEKVIDELYFMFDDAGIKLKSFHLGGDELPHGALIGSQFVKICQC